jgi:hypothetical protein
VAFVRYSKRPWWNAGRRARCAFSARRAPSPASAQAEEKEDKARSLGNTRLPAFRFLFSVFCSFFVARMKRSESGIGIQASWSSPDCALLHPGYALRVAPDHDEPGPPLPDFI